MTLLDLVTILAGKTDAKELAKAASESGVSGARDLYMARGKELKVKAADLVRIWKEESGAKTRSNGEINRYRDWLIEESRTEEQAKQFIIALGQELESANIIAHMSGYLDEWLLAESVRAKMDESLPKPERKLKGLSRKQAEELVAKATEKPEDSAEEEEAEEKPAEPEEKPEKKPAKA